jgi:quinol monooxygenase YgiN
MFVVNAHLTIDPDKRCEFLAVMEVFVASTRQESGNRAFELTAHLSDPGAFTLFEHWESEAALGIHVSQPYFQALVEMIPQLGFAMSGTTYGIKRVEPASETLKRAEGLAASDN